MNPLVCAQLCRAAVWSAQGALAAGPLGHCLARLLLRGAVALAPDDRCAKGWLLYALGVQAARYGATEQAITHAREAARLLPNSRSVRAFLGLTLARGGRRDSAIEVMEALLREGIDTSPSTLVWLTLAWCYLGTGRYAKVAECVERALAAGIETPELQFVGHLARAAEDARLDVARVRSMVRARPALTRMLLEFAQRQALRGRRRLARQVFGALPSAIEQRGLATLGFSALAEGDQETAQWAAGELQKAYPRSCAHAVLRSEMALRRGQRAAAINHAERATRLEPRSDRALEQLGKARLLHGDREAAERAFVECLGAGSDSALAGGVVALALLRRDEIASARLVYRVGRRGDVLGCAYAHGAHALLMARLGEWEEAVKIGAWALECLEELPDWARCKVVAADVGWMLSEALTAVAKSGSVSAGAGAELLAGLHSLPGPDGAAPVSSQADPPATP